MRQLRFAFRTLFRTPFATSVAILSLALGIGANAAIFSLVDQVLLRALPVPDPHALVNLSSAGPKSGSVSCSQAGDCDSVFSYPMFRDLEKTQTVFTGLAAHRNFGANLAYKGETISGEGLEVSGSYFPVLGLQPALGRLLQPADDAAIGEPHVVVLSHDYWRGRFGARPDVLNDTMVVNGQQLTIVGVAPQGFSGTTLGDNPKIFVPITLRALVETNFKGFDQRKNYWAYLFGRLKPGMSREQAQTLLSTKYQSLINELDVPLQKGLSEATLARFRAKTLTLSEGVHGQSSVPTDARTPLTILFAVTAVVLLIACANVANLLLARSSTRAGEMALRLSIGANRGQLIRQLLVESCLLAAMGGIGGLLVSQWTLAFIIRALLPSDATHTVVAELSLPMLGFLTALSLGTGLLFGLFPAINATRPDLASVLKGVSGQPSGGRSAKWFRWSLIGAQITLSMALLASAGLFLQSLRNVSHVDLGLNIDNLYTFGVSPDRNGYQPARSRDLFGRLEDELRAQPGVTAVTAATLALLSGDNWGTGVSVEGFKAGPDTNTNSSENETGAGYFRALGIPLVSGREFSASDVLGSRKVAIVNEAFAKKFGLDRNAVGKLMAFSVGNAVVLDTEIVGLVKDAKYSEVKQVVPPQVFTPYRQSATTGSMNFYYRSSLAPADALALASRVVTRMDPNLPVEDLRTMPNQVRDNVFLDRMITSLSAIFAGLATLLAAVGLYGVLAYVVSQRTREFGLRMALGAPPSRVRMMVLRQVGLLTLVGSVAGAAAALALGRVAESNNLLYQVKGDDPVVLALAIGTLAIVATLAGFIPARRASRIDPMKALRYE